MKTYFAAVFLSIFIPFWCTAQTNDLSADELFVRARDAAFTLKNYDQAITLSKQALVKAPEYVEIQIFLGRLYTWSDKIDSAKVIFNDLHVKGITEEDFYLAYGSLLYWNNDNINAKTIINEGLSKHPRSEDLLLLKSKFSFSNNQFKEAEDAVLKLLAINPKNSEGNELVQRLKNYTAQNAVTISYDFTHFDKQFEDNWHILGLAYKRATNLGSFIFRTNYANKFADNGVQFELEAYPRINKIFYMYLGAGYSNQVGIFPRFRTGASLYANLPKSFEGEIGYRQLHFSSDIWMYTASVGKYYQNFWFNFRTYLSPDQDNISHSYTGTVRYYTKGADDYLGFQIGTGISPEDNRNNLLELNTFKLKTYKVGANYNFSIQKYNLFNVSFTYFNQEYKVGEKGNQYDLGISYSRVF